MRVKNLLILIAIVAAILLVMRYISQVKDTRRGYNAVSNGRIFVNWLLVIILVGSLVGIGVISFTGHKESSAPASTSKSSSAVKPTVDDDLTLSFKKTVRLNDSGVAKVKFLISPQTKVVIKGHRSGIVVETFKPSKANGTVTRSFTFDTAGTYDIIARRGDQKVVKHLKIKESSATDSSNSSFSTINSISSTDSSSTAASSQNNAATAGSNGSGSTASGTSGANTSRSMNGASAGGSYRGSNRGNTYRSNEATDRGAGDNTANNVQEAPGTGNGTVAGQ